MTARVVAVDQGTTSTRALVLDDRGARVVARRGHETRREGAGRVEQDADVLLANVAACLEAAGPADAIGLANQGESCLAWDARTGAPVSPVIVWQDARTEDALRALDSAGHGARARRVSGLPLDPYFSASKLGWILREIPAARAAHEDGRLRLGTTDAFFLDRLAGCFATDVATASRTGLMALDRCAWDAELCALHGVPMACLPEIRATTAGFGAVGGVPVAAAITDQQAALHGHGCAAPGDLKATLGTGAFALGIAAGRPDEGALGGLLPTVAWDLGDGPVHAVDGGIYDVGAAVDWAVRAGLAAGLGDFDGFDGPPAIDRGIVFVPALSGLAAPWWDRTARPVLAGLGAADGTREIRRALLEGIALTLARLVGAMRGVLGAEGGPLSLDGGLSGNAAFTQFLADAMGEPVAVASEPELTALGAAHLAARGAGLPLAAPAPEQRLVTPRDAPREAWAARFEAAVDAARRLGRA